MKKFLIKRRRIGFTLIEIIITIVILGILAAVAIPRLMSPNERAIAAEGKHILLAVLMGENHYFSDHHVYTTNLSDLDVTIPTSANFCAPVLYSTANCNGTGISDIDLARVSRK